MVSIEVKRAGARWTIASLALVASCAADDPAGGDDDDGTNATMDTGAVDTGSAASSGADDDSGSVDDDGTTAGTGLRPNWHEDIAPIVAEHCSGCHTEGGLAFSFDTHAYAEVWAPSMASQTSERLMPPWHAVETDECSPFAAFEHDARLEQADIDAIGAWADIGAPEGDPALAAPLPAPIVLDLADPDLVLEMGGSITVEAEPNVLDQFHCLTFDPGFTEDVYLDGLQVIAGNSKIVHHVLVYVDESAASASWPDGIKRDCGGGSGVPGTRLVAAWVPGGLPTEPPADVGIRVPAGSRLVFNVHYHADVLGPQTDDATGLALRYTTDVPMWVSEFELIGAPGAGDSVTGEFLIPAETLGHVETTEMIVPALGGMDVRIWAVGNHMHKVAVDAKVTILRDGEELCLVQTPRWDFAWQRLYELDLPIEQSFRIEAGDVFRIRCTYDNSLSNPSVVEALAEVMLDETRPVEVGEETLDEMCLAGVGLAYLQ
jgi:hypothetical protein